MTTKWFLGFFLLLTITLTGCAVVTPPPVLGTIHSDVIAPKFLGTSDAQPIKTGTATAKSVLGLFASGDAGIKAACKNGGITKIHSVDYHSKRTLGFIATYTTIVYGE